MSISHVNSNASQNPQAEEQTKPAPRSAVTAAQKLLSIDADADHDEQPRLFERLTALQATATRELCIWAGLPPEPTLELFTLILKQGQGRPKVQAAGRDLIDDVLPESGKDYKSKIRHLKHLRDVNRKARLAGAYPLITLKEGHGRSVDDHHLEGIPTVYDISLMLELLRKLLSDHISPGDLPDDVRQAAKNLIEEECGHARRKNDSGRKPPRQINPEQSIKTAIGHLKKAMPLTTANNVVCIFQRQAPEVFQALTGAAPHAGPDPNPEPQPEPERTPDDPLKAAMAAIEQMRASISNQAQLVAEFFPFDSPEYSESAAILTRCDDYFSRLQVLYCQHGSEGTNFAPPPPAEAVKDSLENHFDPAPASADPLPYKVEGRKVESKAPAPPLCPFLAQGNTEGTQGGAVSEAVRALEAFASVGATSFDLTFGAGKDALGVRKFREGQSVDVLREEIDGWLEAGQEKQASLILRPRGADFIQADDLISEQIESVMPFAFALVETSPGSFQAWFALADGNPENIKARLLERLDADKGANGAVRWPGSRNFKASYAPAFPLIRLVAEQSGRRMTVTELEEAGLLAPLKSKPEPVKQATVSHNAERRQWPSYAICRDRAALKNEKDGGGPNWSQADASFYKLSKLRGFSDAEIQEELPRQRELHGGGKKAYRPDYLRRTAAFVGGAA